MSSTPLVSVLIPGYLSQDTIEGCLLALRRQSYPSLEVVVVDSSPDERTARIVESGFPEVRLIRNETRLLPHAARNAGAEAARGECLVFTDPDIYPSPDWLQIMVSAYLKTNRVIVGAIACYGNRWMDTGQHLCKFDKWLPAGEPRPVDIGPSANIFCTRRVFEAIGGFPPHGMLGDTLLSWHLTERGYELWFVPDAIVYHHHSGGWIQLVRERYARGKEFGYLRTEHYRWPPRRIWTHFGLTILPFRLFGLLKRVARNAWQANAAWDFLRTLPAVVAGEGAWLTGEASAYAAILLKRRSRVQCAS